MLRRSLSILGTQLLRSSAFRFHAVQKQCVPKLVRLTAMQMRPFASNLPPHQVLNVHSGKMQMPALSPTMSSGKIVKWYKKVGDQIGEGDVLCDVETDKATVPFEMLDKGFIAKILLKGDQEVKVGEPVVVIVSKKEAIAAFEGFSGSEPAAKEVAPVKPSAPPAVEKQPEKQAQQKPSAPSNQGQATGNRVVASPLARKTAEEAHVELSGIKGSGPGGRIIKQDVDQAQKSQPQPEQKVTAETDKTQPPAPKKKAVAVPENPVQEIPVTSVRKTIAARLVESKTTIPHYYAQVDINMDQVIKVREELNQNEKENGVKISINDFIMRATALASRDYPDVNVQWGDKTIKKYKYVDLAMAVATDKGLITPIIFRADTKGLLDIARASKDLAKRARESKLLPQEFQGGTCSVSNLGMFGVNSITSIINPPHSLILGVGKSEKKIVFDENSKDETRPYKVANIMTVIASADHRVVDGALAGQWIVRIKKYLESPLHMLL